MKTNKFQPGDRIVIVKSQEGTPEFSAHSFVGHAGFVKDCYRGVYLPPHCAVVLDGEDFFRHCDERWLMLESEYWRTWEVGFLLKLSAYWAGMGQGWRTVGKSSQAEAAFSHATDCMAKARAFMRYSDAAA